MEPTPELIEALAEDDVRSARRAPPGEKLLDGPRLFDLAATFCKAGIRVQHPDADESRVHAMFLERLRLKREMDEA